MSFALIVLGIILLVWYIREKLRAYSVKALLIKSMVSVLFVAVAVTAKAGAPLAPYVVLGLVFGLMGDIWLDLKYVFPEQDRIFTYAGFTVFGIGHLLFISGLLVQYGGGLFLIASFALAAAADGLVAVLEKPMKLSYGIMKPVVLAYGICLFSTVFVSGGLFLLHGGGALCCFFIGSVLFAVSDLVLSGTYFGTGKDRPVDIISNYIFYYGGQFLIAYSLCLL
ncbi:MAG: lysoplasmalogenase [Oscillospiraceae bacterium]|nr:lysoplasmalogenase [Oscillospiraceae bacterium]